MAAQKEAPKKLTRQIIRFCHEYVFDFNGVESARRSGYHGSNRSLAATACRILSMDAVKEKINEIIDKIHNAKTARASQVLSEWTNLGFADPGKLLWEVNELDSQNQPTEPGTLKPISEMPIEVRRMIKSIKYDQNGRPEILFWDKHPALTNLGKFHKINSDSLEVKVDVTISERLRVAREKRMERLKNASKPTKSNSPNKS